MFAFSLSQIIPLLLCVWRVQFVFQIFFLKNYFTPCFWRVPCEFRIFPKFLPCSHVSNVFDVFCVFGVLFCVSCVFLSSLFFLFSKKFAPRIWRVWCVSDSSTCLSWMYFVSQKFSNWCAYTLILVYWLHCNSVVVWNNHMSLIKFYSIFRIQFAVG